MRTRSHNYSSLPKPEPAIAAEGAKKKKAANKKAAKKKANVVKNKKSAAPKLQFKRVVLKLKGVVGAIKKATKGARKGYNGGDQQNKESWTAAEDEVVLWIAAEIEVKKEGKKTQHKWKSVKWEDLDGLHPKHRNQSAVRNRWQNLVEATTHDKTKSGMKPNVCGLCRKWLKEQVKKKAHRCEFRGLTNDQCKMLAEEKKKAACPILVAAEGPSADYNPTLFDAAQGDDEPTPVAPSSSGLTQSEQELQDLINQAPESLFHDYSADNVLGL